MNACNRYTGHERLSKAKYYSSFQLSSNFSLSKWRNAKNKIDREKKNSVKFQSLRKVILTILKFMDMYRLSVWLISLDNF